MANTARAHALAACKRILPPLVRVLINLGISAPELSTVCKHVYVETAAERLAKSAKRVNRSRIAIVTGLTRAEVTRLLKSRTLGAATHERYLHRASRVLKGWLTDKDFVSRSGRPRHLPLKGQRGSFHALVKRYSGDIPPRAMLDELSAMAAIRRQKDGRIALSTRARVGSSMSSRQINSLGSSGRAVLDTLCHNLEDPSNPIFAASVSGVVIDQRIVDLLLARIQAQGNDFLSQIDDQFKHPPRGIRMRTRGRSERIGVTIVAHRQPAQEGRASRS